MMTEGGNSRLVAIVISLIVVVLVVITIKSCGSETTVTETATPLNDIAGESFTEEAAGGTYSSGSGEIVEVPFQYVNGLKIIKVKINNTLTIDMIMDSGCSTSMISIAEAEYLWKKGVLTESDFKGTSKAQVADGRIVDNLVFNLKELVIGDDLVARNVEVLVSENVNAGLLLGNEVLDRVASYTVDMQSRIIRFELY